ncbi:DUF1553 domain-containing protein [Verrucomicrobiaceae bacterium 227]
MSKALPFFLLSLTLAHGAEKVGYNSDVRPILSDKCFLCHGPDKKNNKGDLRLDDEVAAYAALKDSPDKHAIVPGSLEKSASWQRIIATDPDEIMPPSDSNLALSESEKKIIAQWIEQGANYEPHWAFVNLPESIAVPEIANPDWARNPIDQFVAAKLDKEGLEPSPEVDPVRWLRRATFAVTGLPPTLAQISTFEAELRTDQENAYEKAVDRLLSSRAYAEHMTTPWLDGIRYADTWGYHADVNLTAWPYRDYVIRAYEADMPYNQFLTENIAGDLLPNATRDQKLATASNRFNRMTNEGGSSQLEFFVDGVADRVNTIGTSVLGITLECAKCHDHKYDPILAKDYYQIFSFFNSINEDGLYIHGNISPPPSLLLPNESQQKELEKRQQLAANLEKKLAEIKDSARPDFEQWKATLTPGTPPALADLTGDFDFNKNLVSKFQAPKKDEKAKDLAISLGGPQYVDGPAGFGQAVALDGDKGASTANHFLKDRYDPFTIALWVKDTLREERSVVIAQRCHGTEVGYNGIDLRIEDGYLNARVFRAWPDNGIGIRSVKQLPKDEWHHLTYTYDGLSQANGLKLYLDGKLIETTVLNDKLFKSVSTKTYSSGAFTLGAIFRGPGFKGGHVDDLKTFDRPLTPAEIRHISGQTIDLATLPDDELYPYYLANHHEAYRKTIAEISAAQKAIVQQEDTFIEVPVMEEMASPRPAYILDRGDFDAKRTPESRVTRDTLSFLLPFPEDAPRDRLGLTQWLTLPNHPLTSRVYVNRIWQHLLGDGIVRTPENFGLQGDLPTHPQLLDWLSRDFINQGWSTKKLVRQIVLSATFRQQSAYTADLQALDISNKLLARGPSHRLSGEEIRDAALVSSGLLIESNGGPPVHPYAPDGNGKESPNNVHRRSVYSYWKRTKPQPNMTIFDKPSLEVCSVKRSRTNSPSAALVLLNDRHFVEAARKLATFTIQEKPSLDDRIKLAWLRVTSLTPTKDELRILKEIFADSLADFQTQPAEADKLLKVGVSPLPKDLDPVETAAMTVVCQAIYNSDAAIWKR